MKMNNEWTIGKHALITGASNGIGRELARCLAGKCRKLTLIAFGLENLQVLKKELDLSKAKIEICSMDICEINKMKNLINKPIDLCTSLSSYPTNIYLIQPVVIKV